MKRIFKLLVICVLINMPLLAQDWIFTEPTKLNKYINSAAEESMPVFSKDSMILYFVRTYELANKAGEFDQDIWFSKKDKNGEFGKAEQLTALNNEYNNAVFGISKNGNTLYLLATYEGKKDKTKGCATSTFSNNKWSDPKKLDIPGLAIEGDFYTFTLNEKEDAIVISFIGPNSAGEEDLYFSQKSTSGAWSEIKSLGGNINSKGFEISPFLSKTGDTLFFSSNGHGGFGDADIFYAVKTGKNWDSWSNPINLGASINSAKFDAYFSYSEKQVFWSSNRGDDKYADIYTSYPEKKTPLIGDISSTDVTVYQGTDGKIDLNISGGKSPYRFKWSNAMDMEDPRGLKAGTYSVLVSDTWNQELELTAVIKEPAPIVENLEEIIYFDLDKSSLTEESKLILDSFLVKLKDKKDYSLMVTSHCDQRASEPYNINLSKRRLNTVSKYLVKNGINKKEIKGEYKGKSEPKHECEVCSDEQYRENRRTTLKVVIK